MSEGNIQTSMQIDAEGELFLGQQNVVESERDRSRDKWGSNTEFLLAIIGYTVGIASIWRFPIMCAKNGGGAFLVPYFFFLLVIGSPLYYLELNIGQFSGKSACKAFEYCRLFKGILLLSLDIFLTIQLYRIINKKNQD